MLVPMSTVIDVQHVTKAYGGRRAVDDVSLAIEEGEIFAILGPNGAGKTTLVESIGGLRSIDSGSITVLGLDPRRDRAALRQVVGVQLQQSALPDHIRVGEAVDLYASFYPEPGRPRPAPRGARAWATAARRSTRPCRAARSSASRSRSRSSATRGSRSSTS